MADDLRDEPTAEEQLMSILNNEHRRAVSLCRVACLAAFSREVYDDYDLHLRIFRAAFIPHCAADVRTAERAIRSATGTSSGRESASAR